MIKKFLPILLAIALATLLVSIWFRFGLIYGGGDVGLTTYNPKRISEVISKVWWEDTAPGFPRPQGLTSLPTEVALSYLQDVNLPPFMMQAILFGALIFLMGIGMYLLTKEIVESDQKEKIALLAGLFYIVNPYMMVQVWHRFIHSAFFLAAALPFFILFWIRWIEKKDYRSLIFFALANFIFSFLYSTLAFVVTVWLLLGFFSLLFLCFPWRGIKGFLNVFVRTALGMVLWVLINAWWLVPTLSISPSLLSAQHSVLSSLFTLLAISNQSIIPHSLTGLNPFYLFSQKELGEVFSNPLFLTIPWIPVVFIFIGIYASLRQRMLLFWSGMFLLAVFLAKGISPPFGAPFLYGFIKLFIMGVLRNPFEKLGILIPLSSSILFSLGFVTSWRYFKNKQHKKFALAGRSLLLLSLGLFFVIYHWPFWSGTLFGTLDRPNFVEIPSYYQQANNWIKDQKKDGNILHLPLLLQEGLVYRWQYGYSGVDSTTEFFTSNPSISMGFNLFYLDNALRTIDLLSEVTVQEEEKVKALFKAFNIRFIVLHHDVDWKKSKVRNPLKIVAKKLEQLTFIKKQKEFGSLTVYAVEEKDYLSKLYFQEGFDFMTGSNADNPSYKSHWAWYARSNPQQLLISDLDNQKENFIGERNLVNLPKKVISFFPTDTVNADDAVKQLPAVRFSPKSIFYPIIRLKENIQLMSLQNSLNNLELEFSGKRLAEAYKMQKEIPNVPLVALIEDYEDLLPKAMTKLELTTKETTLNNEVPIGIKNILNNHKIILQHLFDNAINKDKETLNQAIKLLSEIMTKQGIIAIYEQTSKQNLGKTVYRFDVPQDGTYELLIADSGVDSLYENNLKTLEFQIDDRHERRGVEKKLSFLSYGKIFLQKGEHEISYPQEESVNLVKDQPAASKEVEITSGQHDPKDLEVNVTPFNPGSTYAISFDFWVKKGNDPTVRVVQDSDPIDLLGFESGSKERLYQYDQKIAIDTYDKYWRKFIYLLESRENSSELSIQILATPWDDCETILAFRKFLCKTEIKRNYERPTTLMIRNLKVSRVFNNPLILRKEIEASPAAQIGITYSKPKKLQYTGQLKVEKKGFLVFSETFDKGWKLTLEDESGIFEPKSHHLANMYANAWYIDKVGEFKFNLEYKPQRSFDQGVYVGIGSTIVLLILPLLLKVRKRL